eukprot:TRINITY_DN59896_c0_g1_i1.p1 TRINITY_DN59896_c0_g1~~TRINITY_DN59896_c0_g1_i1.p1  ORF type:complete len:178 (-),score=21.52 TRINITY_DN59896_c0_g1_i1:23-556(-)
MGHGYKHKIVKAELVNWLWNHKADDFWQTLERFARETNWLAFAKCVKGAWQRNGGTVGDLNFLDNKQHSVHVWQLINRSQEPGQKPGPCRWETKTELINWLWYYENDQFWDDCKGILEKKKGWRNFAAMVKREWKNNGGNVAQLNFLDNSQHATDVYKVLFQNAQPQLPRQPQTLPR